MSASPTMRLTRLLGLCGALLALSLFACANALAAEIFVRFEPSASAGEQAMLLEAVDGERERTLGRLGVQVVEVGSAAAALKHLNSSDEVVYAERAGLVYADLSTSDPFLRSSAWQLTNPGFPAAWDRTTGSPSVVVAVLDTGVQAGHEDLGTLTAGYDFLNNDTDPADDNGHGTAVAGVVAAQGGNGRGVAGSCWGCSVMPVKVLGANGTGTWSAVAAGILWATDNGADVINMSLSSMSATQTVADAVAYAIAHDVVVVASAGNSDVSTPYYPAAYPGVVAVGAVDQNDVRYATVNGNVSTAWGSNWGDWVKVVAPGCTNSTWNASVNYPVGTYVYGFCGTSTASPYVAGLAGLMRSYNPSLSAAATASAIYSTTTSLSGGLSQYGRIDAGAAMAAVAGSDATSPETSITAAPASPTTATAASFSFSSTEAGTFECSLDGATYATCSSPTSYSGLATGAHAFFARATDEAGNVDATPAMHSWTVLTPDTGDVIAPETLLTSTPDDSTTSSSASFSFSSTEAGTFECSLDGAVHTTCSSPQSYSGLAVGAHTFSVRAVDGEGNVDATPASDSWTVTAAPADTTAPETTITASPAVSSTSTAASFSFSSTEAGTFECSLDGAAYATCSSPESHFGLAVGIHSFSVRATDAAGNTDATADSYTWTVIAAGGGGGGGGGGTAPDLKLSVTADRDRVAAGEVITYSATVSMANAGGGSELILVATLPQGAVLVGSYANRGAGCVQSGTQVSCRLGFLSSPLVASVSLQVRFDRAATSTVTLVVSARENDPVPGNNSVSLAVTVGDVGTVERSGKLLEPLTPDLKTTLSTPRRRVARGGLVIYTLRVVNNGDRASAVVVSLRLPRQLTVVRAPGCSRVGATLRCRLGAVRAGQSRKLRIVLKARSKGKAIVRATVSARGERHTKDNVASIAVKVA